MRKVVVLAVAVVAALGVTASSATSAASETGVTARTIVIGGTFPLTGPASLYAPIPVGDEGVLLLHQLAEGPGRQARRLRPPDRLQVLRRRLQPGEHACSRRGSSSRRTRSSRSSARWAPSSQRGDPPVPERPEGPADPQRDRRVGLGQRARSSTRGPAAGSPRTTTRAASTARRSRATARTRRSPSSTRTTASARSILDGLKAGLGAKASNIVGEESYEVTAADVRTQIARLRGVGCHGPRDLRDAEVHGAGLRDRERARAGRPR